MDRFEITDRILVENENIHILDNEGNILIDDTNVEDIERVDNYAEKIIDFKINKKQSWSRIKENIEEFVKSLSPETYIKSGEESEGYSLSLLEETDLLDQWGTNTYYVSGSEEHLDLFLEQFESISSFGHTKPELRGILSALSENGKAPSKSQLRERSDVPTDQPFRKQFGDLSRASSSAGLENYNETVDKEILEHELRGKFYRENKIPSLNEINEDIRMPSGSIYRNGRYFESFSAAKKDAGLGTEAELKDSVDTSDKYHVD